MSRTTVIICIGLVLVVAFLLTGRLVKQIGITRAAEDFLLVWFALALGNMAVGVIEAGYSLVEELPIFLLIFAIPAAVAVTAHVVVRRQHRPS